ncbi:MAG: hypothetical protein RR730_00905 [Clostridium sp.]
MKKFNITTKKFKSLRVLPMIMVLVGSLFILIFMPIWLWFVLIGALLVVVGLSI